MVSEIILTVFTIILIFTALGNVLAYKKDFKNEESNCFIIAILILQVQIFLMQFIMIFLR